MEIKYRAWDIKDKEYVKVHSIHFGTRKVIVSVPRHGNHSLSFDDIILEQYTGMKDRNGNEVYEGDEVLLYYCDLMGDTHITKIIIKNPFDYTVDEAMQINHLDELEIVGTIH